MEAELIWDKGKLVAHSLETMNKRIRYLLDADHELGHAMFIGCQSLLDVRDVFLQNVIPMLEEYFFGVPQHLAAVLGCSKVAGSGNTGGSTGAILTRVSHEGLGFDTSMTREVVELEVDSDFSNASADEEVQPFIERLINGDVS